MSGSDLKRQEEPSSSSTVGSKSKRVKSAVSKDTDKEWLMQRHAVDSICRCISRYHHRGFNVTVAIEAPKNQLFLCNSLNENPCESFARIAGHLAEHETKKYDVGIHKMLVDGNKVIDSNTDERMQHKKMQREVERLVNSDKSIQQRQKTDLKIAHTKARSLRKRACLSAAQAQADAITETIEAKKRDIFLRESQLNPLPVLLPSPPETPDSNQPVYDSAGNIGELHVMRPMASHTTPAHEIRDPAEMMIQQMVGMYGIDDFE